MNSKYIISLNSKNNLSKSIAGGKASSLNILLNNNIPVPSGFVLTTKTFHKFLEYSNLNLTISKYIAEFDPEHPDAINKFKRLQNKILKGKLPEKMQKAILKSFHNLKSPYVAVRSSAVAEDGHTASWAGQLESFTYTDENAILDNIKKCWASVFSVHALHYKLHKSTDTNEFSIGVIVQRMMHSEASGVAFSRNPLDKSNNIIIEAGLGLCETLVNGEIDPDRYTYDKKSKTIIKIVIGKQPKYKTFLSDRKIWRNTDKKSAVKQKLDNTIINKLALKIIKIEKIYKHPVDVEWTIEKGKLYVLQARPITS